MLLAAPNDLASSHWCRCSSLKNKAQESTGDDTLTSLEPTGRDEMTWRRKRPSGCLSSSVLSSSVLTSSVLISNVTDPSPAGLDYLMGYESMDVNLAALDETEWKDLWIRKNGSLESAPDY